MTSFRIICSAVAEASALSDKITQLESLGLTIAQIQPVVARLSQNAPSQ